MLTGKSRRAVLRLLAGGSAAYGVLSTVGAMPALAGTVHPVGVPPHDSAPTLFGLRQRLLPDTPRFRERSRVLRSWRLLDVEDELAEAVPALRDARERETRYWLQFLREFQGYAPAEQVRAVHKFVNSLPYVPDARRDDGSDLWSMPSDFLSGGGDCEDFAITKYTFLRWLGFHSERLRIVLGRLPAERLYHAVLTVQLNHEFAVLDNRSPKVLSERQASRDFVPILSMNESRYWLHYR